jgi:hypothetical protein
MITVTEIRTLAELEREAIFNAMAAAPNTIVAAKLLGMGKTTLYRKLKELGYAESASLRQSEVLAISAAQALLFRQAAALRTIPVRTNFTTEKKPLRFLQIPSSRLESERATLRCPCCKTALIDTVQLSATSTPPVGWGPGIAPRNATES